MKSKLAGFAGFAEWIFFLLKTVFSPGWMRISLGFWDLGGSGERAGCANGCDFKECRCLSFLVGL